MIRRGPSGSAERALGFGNRVPHARPQRGHHAPASAPEFFPLKAEISVLDITSERAIAGYGHNNGRQRGACPPDTPRRSVRSLS